MDQLVTFWQKYRPQADPQALLYLRRVAFVQHMEKGAILKHPHQALPYFCIVLHGLVGGFEAADTSAGTVAKDHSGDRAANHANDPAREDNDLRLRELILPMDYFSGPAHLFTGRNRAIEYRAQAHTSILRIPLSHAREGQQHHPDLAELFQVMKQRKINLLRQQVALYQERDHYRRYYLYRRLLPDWAYLLPRKTQCQFLQISKTHFHRIKEIYLRNPKKY